MEKNNKFIEEMNEILENWESQRTSVWTERERLTDELQDLDMHIEVMHDAIREYMKKHPDTVPTSNVRLGSLINKSYPEMLIEVAKQIPGGIVTVEEATDILSRANIGIDRATLRHNIGNTLLRLSSHHEHFAKIGRGQFRYTNHVQPQGVKKAIRNNKVSEPSGVRQTVKDIKDKNPQMTKKDVLNKLLRDGFDFHGKNPASAVNFSWGYWGYSKEGKQQQLPIDSEPHNQVAMQVPSATASDFQRQL